MLISRLAESDGVSGVASGVAKKFAGCVLEEIAGTTCPLLDCDEFVAGIGPLDAATRSVLGSTLGGMLSDPLPVGNADNRLLANASSTLTLPPLAGPLLGPDTPAFIAAGLGNVIPELVGLPVSGAAR